MRTRKYNGLPIRSKLDLAKAIYGKGVSKERALFLVEKVLENPTLYWRDNKKFSKPKELKWVRSAQGTIRGELLELINERLLVPQDVFMPSFVFGAKKGSSHVSAVKLLAGAKKRRTVLALDISRFFEQITERRLIEFLMYRWGYAYKGACLIARICCVPSGEKGTQGSPMVLARGFATSSRLAVWCSLDLFKQVEGMVKTKLRENDPVIAIYMDDIGISAAKVDQNVIKSLKDEVTKLMGSYKNRPLRLNPDKTRVSRHDQGIEHLGVKMLRNGLSVGAKARSKMAKLSNAMKTAPKGQKDGLQRQYMGSLRYKAYVKSQGKKP